MIQIPNIEHPMITQVNRTGETKSFKEILAAEMEANKYIEDIYEEEIRIGDTYYEDNHGQLVHEKSLAKYALDHCDLTKKTR